MQTISRKYFFGVLTSLILALMLAMPTHTALAADVCVDLDGISCPFTTIQDAVAAASTGDTINVHAGTYVLGSVLNLNKADLTLQGIGDPLIQVSGTGYRFHITAAGVTLDGFRIEKTDKTGGQDIIYIGASDTTITNNEIFGKFVIGDPEVSRAMVLTGGLNGLNISNNTIHHLRQPAYISGVDNGMVSNNYVYSTKGWVIEGGNLTFTDNTWGTGANVNVYDIAILSGVSPLHYTDIVGMSNANNGAVIEDQRVSPAVLSVVYVNAATSFSSDLGGRYHPYSTITPAIARVVPGGTIHVAAGAYAADLTINKALTLLGPNANVNPTTGTRLAEAILYPSTNFPDPAVCTNMAYLTTSNIAIKGFTFNGDNPLLTSGIMIDGADVNACEILSGYEGMGGIVVENNILKNATNAGIDFYNYTNTAATTDNYIRYNRIEDIGENTYDSGVGILTYNNFYADVTDNVLDDVRTGIQTGNYSQANPGTTGSISNNTINAWRLGIFHNLWYSNASAIPLDGNTINAVTYPEVVKWNGILLSSFDGAANTTVTDNIINIPESVTFPSPGYTAGYNVWSNSTNVPLTIDGGAVTGGDYGIFLNNFEGYNSNGDSTSIVVDDVTLQDSTIAGIYVKDSPDNTNGSTVFANIKNSTLHSNGTGILIEGTDATAQANYNNISDNPAIGINNTSSNLMNAEANWWGAVSGPGIVGTGAGDPVSTNVDYSPWCGDAACSFLTELPPSFSKTSPENAATQLSTTLTLYWGESSGATSYEYCISTNPANCTTWVNRGTNRTANITGLNTGTSYYWQVRAHNIAGYTYANGSAATVWSFTTATPIFTDVPDLYWASSYIEQLYTAGITGGCGTSPLLYCPETTVTRSQMAVFLLRGIHSSSYSPPAVGSSTGFGDVPTDYWSAAWIKQLAAEGITGGCGSSNYCPEYSVTRDQMAVFLLRSKYGSSYSPPAVGISTGFEDVPVDHWAAPWIKQLVTEGITAGCGSGNYCPDLPVTRAQMAVFLVRTFNLP